MASSVNHRGSSLVSLENLQEIVPDQDINAIDGNYQTYLFLLKEGEAVASAQFLIDNGIDVNWTDENEENALFSLSHLSNEEEYQVAKLLIANGLNVNDVNIFKENILFQTKNPLLIRLVIESGINVNQVDEKDDYPDNPETNNRTPLFFFLHEEYLPILEMLLDAGADVTHRDDAEQTLLFHIGRDPSGLVTSLLLNRGLKALINEVDKDGNNALISYIYFWPATISLLLDNGIDVSNLNAYYENAYFYLQYINTERVRTNIKLMIDKYPAGINTTDRSGQSILKRAVKRDDLIAVQFLLDNNVELHQVNNRGKNVLFCAKSVPIAKLLVEAGVELNKIDDLGKNALYYVKIEVASYLAEIGIDVTRLQLPVGKIMHLDQTLDNLFVLLLDHGMNVENFHYNLAPGMLFPKFLINSPRPVGNRRNIRQFLLQNGHSSTIDSDKLFAIENIGRILHFRNIRSLVMWCMVSPTTVPVFEVLKRGSSHFNSILFYFQIFPVINITYLDLYLGTSKLDTLEKLLIVAKLTKNGQLNDDHLTILTTDQLNDKDNESLNKLVAPLMILSLYSHAVTLDRITFHEKKTPAGEQDPTVEGELRRVYDYLYENAKNFFFYYYTTEEILDLLQTTMYDLVYRRLKRDYLDQRTLKEILEEDYQNRSAKDVITERYPGLAYDSLEFLWTILFEK